MSDSGQYNVVGSPNKTSFNQTNNDLNYHATVQILLKKYLSYLVLVIIMLERSYEKAKELFSQIQVQLEKMFHHLGSGVLPDSTAL